MIKVKVLLIKISQTIKNLVKNIPFSKGAKWLRDKIKLLKKFFAHEIVKRILLTCVLVIAMLQVAFAILIYKFNMENPITLTAAKIIPYPIVVVNQDFITYDQYHKEKEYIHHFYTATKQENIDFDEVDKQIINQLIENRIISTQALLKGVKVSNKEINETLQDIINQNGGEEKVNKVLFELYGLNVKKFKRLVKTQLLRDKLNDSLIMRVSARHILVRVDSGAEEAKVNEAKAKIDDYRKQVIEGLDFSEAAKKYSEDIGSADQGGKLEPFASGEMVEEFSKTAFNTPVGEISEPIRTEFGWHIIKVEGKDGKINKSFGDWLSETMKKSLIIRII